MKMPTLLSARCGNRINTALRVFVSTLVLPTCVWASEPSSILDDFSDALKSNSGAERIVIDDASVGGKSSMAQAHEGGVLSVTGEVVPGRGQPGWMSLVVLASPNGAPTDLSQYEGIKIRIRVNQGNVSVSANSSEVVNFDYHSMAISTPRGEFKDVMIPFKDMKRMWSEQTKLNPATITSVTIVAADLRRASFSYDVDEVSFY